MERSEYMRLKLSNLHWSVVQKYNLKAKATRGGYVHMEIQRGVYGLPQVGLITQQLLEKRLNNQEYQQSKITLGLWTHDWRPICFSIYVNDFGVKYVGTQHAKHLMEVLQENYKISSDWKGKKYLGLDIHWEYDKRTVHLSMLRYVE